VFCLLLTANPVPAGIFDSVTLIVKEPNGQFRPENEWTRQGTCLCSLDTICLFVMSRGALRCAVVVMQASCCCFTAFQSPELSLCLPFCAR
jgi:hypothetical protein